MAKVCSSCPLWVNVRGKHPQTGLDIDQWNCSFSWLPLIQVEAIKVFSEGTTGIQAATESFRNEMVRQNEGPRIIAGQMLQRLESASTSIPLISANGMHDKD